MSFKTEDAVVIMTENTITHPQCKHTFIVAGSHRQFDYYVRDYGLDRQTTRYVWSSEQLRGIRGCTLKLVGTWYEQPRAREIIKIAEYLGFSIQ